MWKGREGEDEPVVVVVRRDIDFLGTEEGRRDVCRLCSKMTAKRRPKSGSMLTVSHRDTRQLLMRIDVTNKNQQKQFSTSYVHQA